ncbi:hypothetical protein DVR12_26505 [Chitinophaga silvatica]|uniref:Tail specific protease domain-containing protein n=1 Tax=Chitinophaga silvatica TaxID=2282649 RepID=A0A3E1Y251_9BACT|nr:S41 family peptidase [Chitinophaga silvatica]RFS18752.1 hypothetical protein DVR12_26505 [Chitinophaga silvatica]
MQQIFKPVLLSTLLIGATLFSSAQVNKFSDFTKEDLVKDYKLAMDILKKQHPNPYKFIDSATLDKRVDSLMQLALAQQSPLSGVQFSPIYLIRDVHTSCRFSEDVAKNVLGSMYFFPLPVLIEREKIIVNIKGEAIPFGSEILSVNKQTAKELIASLAASTYSDGYSNTGTDRVSGNFQTILSMKSPDCREYEISYTEPGSKAVKKLRLPSLLPSPAFHSTKQAVLPVNQLARSYWIYSSYEDQNSTGILTVNSFNLQESYAYKEFSSFFKEVKKRGCKNVVIDIRSNGGGNPAISALLFSFLAKESFKNVYNYRTKTIDLAYSEYATMDGRKYSDDDIRNNKNFLYQRFDKDSASGFYIGNARLKEGQMENFPADKDAFSGNVYVLTGGGTVSAATYFATLVQKNKRGIIIGKETGSGEQSTTAAWFVNYQLPLTKFILTIPMTELNFFNASTDNGRGVIPDKEVPLEKYLSYVRESKDPEMTFALEYINGK